MNSEDEARTAYRLFLGREPRPQEIIARQKNPTSMRELMDELLASKEFEQRGTLFRPYIKNGQSVCGYSFDFLVADPIADAWYGGWTGETEAPEVRWCLERIREGMTALDVGPTTDSSRSPTRWRLAPGVGWSRGKLGRTPRMLRRGTWH